MKKIFLLLLLIPSLCVAQSSHNIPALVSLRAPVYDNIVFGFEPSKLQTMMQENATTGVDITPVTADNDPVGLLYCTGNNSYKCFAPNDGLRPILKSDGTINSYLEFDSKRISLTNSQTTLTQLIGTSPIWTIVFRVKMLSSDGAVQVLCDTRNSTNGSNGITVLRSSDNKWYLQASKTNPNTSLISTTGTTGTHTVADGWKTVMFSVNGVGASAGTMRIEGQTAQTFAVTAGANGIPALSNGDLLFGVQAASFTNPAKVGLAWFFLYNTTITTQQFDDLCNYNPARNNDPFYSLDYNYVIGTSRTFQDAALTTPAVNDNDPVRSVESTYQGNFSDLHRRLIASVNDITFSGTSGTANVNFGGTNYLATFNTNLLTTALNFVSTNAANILSQQGLTVRCLNKSGDAGSLPSIVTNGVLEFTFPATGVFSVPTVTNVSGDLSGTVTDPGRPTLKTGILGGTSVLSYDGLFNNLNFSGSPQESGGRFTIMYLIKSNKEATPSGNIHIATADGTGSQRLLRYGETYVEAPPVIELIHGPVSGGDPYDLGTGNAFKWIPFVWQRDGTTVYAWDGTKVKATYTANTGVWIYTRVGHEEIPSPVHDNQLKAYFKEFTRYTGLLPESLILQWIDSQNSLIGP